jgi:hypothetical protein
MAMEHVIRIYSTLWGQNDWLVNYVTTFLKSDFVEWRALWLFDENSFWWTSNENHDNFSQYLCFKTVPNTPQYKQTYTGWFSICLLMNPEDTLCSHEQLYIHVTMLHPNKFIFNNQPDALIIQIYSVIKLSLWSRGNVLAFSTQVRGFKPGRSHRIFKGGKILSTPSFGGEVKPSVPCRTFAACKRSLMAVIETPCRQNYLTTFLAHSSTFRC